MEKFNFIRTTDNDTKEKLLMEGFRLMSYDGDIYTFINDTNKLNFADTVDVNKLQFTNLLCI